MCTSQAWRGEHSDYTVKIFLKSIKVNNAQQTGDRRLAGGKAGGWQGLVLSNPAMMC